MPTRIEQIVVLLLGLSLCVFWSLLTWPGSNTDGKFYPYPVTAPLVGFWAIGWVVVLTATFFILKMRKMEMMRAIAFLGICCVGACLILWSPRKKNPDIETGKRFAKITDALLRYASDHDGRLPVKLSDLVPQYLSLEQLSLFYPSRATNGLPTGWNREPALIDRLSDFVYLGTSGIPHGMIAYGRNKEPSFAPFEMHIVIADGGGSHVTPSELDDLLHTNESAVLARLRRNHPSLNRDGMTESQRPRP